MSATTNRSFIDGCSLFGNQLFVCHETWQNVSCSAADLLTCQLFSARYNILHCAVSVRWTTCLLSSSIQCEWWVVSVVFICSVLRSFGKCSPQMYLTSTTTSGEFVGTCDCVQLWEN